MPDAEALSAEVFLDGQIPADEERSFVDALVVLGLRTHAMVVPPRRGLGELHWLVLISLPLQAFLTSMGSKLAEDAYHSFQRAVGRLLGRDQKQPAAEPPRPLILQDTASGLQVVLEADLPGDAYLQLVGLDLTRFQLGPLHYDRHERRWRSELDEARARPAT
ncbi:MAG TPA: hypothetical protein VL330_21100 [Actinomycetes bacterium]|nr:hypothetical protein [Actinomycetes bacterium]